MSFEIYHEDNICFENKKYPINIISQVIIIYNPGEPSTSIISYLPLLLQDYSVKEIGLFGSFSDDSYTDESDIDLLVEFEKPIGWKYFSLEIFLENVFRRKIDLVTKNALREQMKDGVLNQVKYV